MDYSVSLVGLCVGFLVGLTGMGGGALMTPIMILLFGVPPIYAVGVDFVYSTITKALGTIIHIRQKHVNFKIALYLSCGSIPAIILSTSLIQAMHKHHGEAANALILHSIGVVLLIAAFFILLKPFIMRRAKKIQYEQNKLTHFGSKNKPLFVICTGATIGFIIGMTSIGSGSLIIVALAFLYPRLPMKELVGTDIFQAFLLLFTGSLVYIFAGTINWHLVGSLLLGSLPGVFIGSKLTQRVPENFLRPILAILLAITGVKLIL